MSSTLGVVSTICTKVRKGLAPIGDRDILMADFGPTNRFRHGANVDGIVWRITPEGEKTRVIDGRIGDPNFVLMLSDGMFLVSDDATDEIFIADTAGNIGLFTNALQNIRIGRLGVHIAGGKKGRADWSQRTMIRKADNLQTIDGRAVDSDRAIGPDCDLRG